MGQCACGCTGTSRLIVRQIDDSDRDESVDDGSSGKDSNRDETIDDNTDANYVQIEPDYQRDGSSACRNDESTAEGVEHADADCSTSKSLYTMFEALSYVWGSQDDPSYVRVLFGAHLGTLPITRNLDVTLRHLRQPMEARYIWVDALCINQADLDEKSGQVGSMHHVFMAATRTVAWLGPETNDSDTAIMHVQSVYNQISGDPDLSEGMKIVHYTGSKHPKISALTICREMMNIPLTMP